MYSQVSQDEFVKKIIGNTGFFLDIGAGWVEPQLNSNSLFLEEQGWDGICIDGDLTSANNRKNKAIRAKVLNVMVNENNLKSILDENNAPKTIDYVSLDIEPYSLIGLLSFPFSEYEFKVLTFEHDSYRTGENEKLKSHDILLNHGYYCLCEDIKVPSEFSNEGYFEDWWINKKYFSDSFIQKNTFKKCFGQHIIDNISI